MNKRALTQLGFIFYLSGLSALIYQVSWQRLLFTGIGIDLTSITVIVSIFMVGLGVGAYFGGRIADKFNQHILLIFCLFEGLIGLFGLISYDAILALQDYLIHANRIEVALANFLLLLLPTFMMGATLPLLTCFYNKYMGNIGEAIGVLYFCNTAGAGTGALASGLFFYNYLTLSQTIMMAGFINLGIAIFTYYRYGKRASQEINYDSQSKTVSETTNHSENWQPKKIYILAFASGALSLSIEVIWIRIMSFSHMSVPQAFSYTLALFLLGISGGAIIGKRICQKNPNTITIQRVGHYFLLSALIDIIVILLAYYTIKLDYALFLDGAKYFILLSASIRGIVFPLVHHLGTWQLKSGKQISNVYFSNVLGSSLAPILIGFILLDIFSTQQVYLWVCFFSIAVGLWCLPQIERKSLKAKLGTVSLVALFASLFLSERFFNVLSNYPDTLIENKHGFIQVYRRINNPDDPKDDYYMVFGANVYDGGFNTNIFRPSNGIERAYLLPMIKPEMEEVLVIGLSTGSWVRVLATLPNIKKITVIEINPDYVKLIAQYPEVAPLLKDKRIEFIVDDGRRWVRKNEQQFDLILMNTTWHWRAYSTNLLSQEYLTLIKSRLKPNGIAFYNTTQSVDAFKTARSVFDFVYFYSHMAMVSNQSLEIPNDEQSKINLSALYYPELGEKVFKTDEELDKALKIIKYGKKPFVHYDKVNWDANLHHQPEIITDNNMITEYKYGKGLLK